MESKLSNHLYSIKCLTCRSDSVVPSVLVRSTFADPGFVGILDIPALVVVVGSFGGSWVGNSIGASGLAGRAVDFGSCAGLVGDCADRSSGNDEVVGGCTLLGSHLVGIGHIFSVRGGMAYFGNCLLGAHHYALYILLFLLQNY